MNQAMTMHYPWIFGQFLITYIVNQKYDSINFFVLCHTISMLQSF